MGSSPVRTSPVAPFCNVILTGNFDRLVSKEGTSKFARVKKTFEIPVKGLE
jgi:hypothetical protein